MSRHTPPAGFRRRSLIAAIGAAAISRPGRAAPGGETIRIGLVNYPPNIKPFETTGSSSGAVKLMIYAPLLSYDADGEIRPELAESIRADGDSAYIVRLREGAKFHNGDFVTADDVLYSFAEMMGPRSTAFLRPDLEIVQRIEALDARTIRFALKQPSAPFANLLASYHAPVISTKSSDPAIGIGAGPYVVTGMERGVNVELTRFPGYYRTGKPLAERLLFTAYTDENLRVAALQSGDVDIIEGVPWQSMGSIEHDPKLQLDTVTSPFMYLVFNTGSGPFADARVRQAIGLGVKREELVKAACYGRGSPLGGLPIPPGSPFAHTGPDLLARFDPDRARQLLRDAGYPNGFTARLLTTPNPSIHLQTAEVVQQNLSEIGVNVELQIPDWPQRVGAGNKGQYQFAVMGTAVSYNDPDALSQVIGSGPPSYARSFGFKSERIDGLLAAGRRTLDPAARRAIYDDLQKAAAEECPVVWLNWREQAYGLQRGVRGFHNMPGFLTFYSPITLMDTTRTPA